MLMSSLSRVTLAALEVAILGFVLEEDLEDLELSLSLDLSVDLSLAPDVFLDLSPDLDLLATATAPLRASTALILLL